MGGAALRARHPDDASADASAELGEEGRKALLAADAELRRDYAAVVGAGIIDEDDFWASRRALQVNEAARRRGGRVGETSALVSDVRGARGDGALKIKLDKEQVHEIFSLKPHVRRAYDDHVRARGRGARRLAAALAPPRARPRRRVHAYTRTLRSRARRRCRTA